MLCALWLSDFQLHRGLIWRRLGDVPVQVDCDTLLDFVEVEAQLFPCRGDSSFVLLYKRQMKALLSLWAHHQGGGSLILCCPALLFPFVLSGRRGSLQFRCYFSLFIFWVIIHFFWNGYLERHGNNCKPTKPLLWWDELTVSKRPLEGWVCKLQDMVSFHWLKQNRGRNTAYDVGFSNNLCIFYCKKYNILRIWKMINPNQVLGPDYYLGPNYSEEVFSM